MSTCHHPRSTYLKWSLSQDALRHSLSENAVLRPATGTSYRLVSSLRRGGNSSGSPRGSPKNKHNQGRSSSNSTHDTLGQVTSGKRYWYRWYECGGAAVRVSFR
jgi:hypothetical protein